MQPIFVSIPLPCLPGKASSANIRLLCSVTGSTEKATWQDVTGSTPLELCKDVVHFSTKVSGTFWLLVIHDKQREPDSALTLANRWKIMMFLATVCLDAETAQQRAFVLKQISQSCAKHGGGLTSKRKLSFNKRTPKWAERGQTPPGLYFCLFFSRRTWMKIIIFSSGFMRRQSWCHTRPDYLSSAGKTSPEPGSTQ